MTRRDLLKHAGAIGAPAILGAADKAGSKRPIIGEGQHRFEVIHDWGELPAHIKYGNTHGVCEDSQGRIYIHHTVHATSESHDSMVIFDEKGKFIRSWGKDFKGGAHGLHIRKEGRQEFLYLCDTVRGVVVKTTTSGEEVLTLGYPKESPAYKPGADGQLPKYSPTNLAVAPNGDIYVGDGYGSFYINQYNAKGEFIRTFGGAGKGPGQLEQPHGIWMDMRGAAPLLLVADRRNARLQYFTLDGKHHSFVGGVVYPCHFHERKGLLVVPELDARVTLMDKNNKVLAYLGENKDGKQRQLRLRPREEFIPGKFVCPHGACFDHNGDIFVVEWVEAGRVTKLRQVS
jgi:hypothetical protein